MGSFFQAVYSYAAAGYAGRRPLLHTTLCFFCFSCLLVALPVFSASAQIKDCDGNVVCEGTVGTSGEDINFNSNIFTVGASVDVTALTITVNGLANSLPINGQTTGEISDRFAIFFVPAGYVFSIWGLILTPPKITVERWDRYLP